MYKSHTILKTNNCSIAKSRSCESHSFLWKTIWKNISAELVFQRKLRSTKGVARIGWGSGVGIAAWVVYDPGPSLTLPPAGWPAVPTWPPSSSPLLLTPALSLVYNHRIRCSSPLCTNSGTHLYPESTTLLTEMMVTGVELKPET